MLPKQLKKRNEGSVSNERETEQDVLLKAPMRGMSDYIGRVLPNMRHEKLRLIKKETPDWRD